MRHRTLQFYRPELDALRFLAFLMVFTHHAFLSSVIFALPSLPWIERIPAGIALGGQFGVDLFFVLSAYLITELLLREKLDSGTVDVKGFYVRRILRIWPLYFIFLLFCLVLPAFSPAVFPMKAFTYFVLLSGNIYFTLYGGFPSPVAPLWSVSIEEQFYLIWPWVMRFANRTQLAIVSLVLILGAFCTRWVLLVHAAPRRVLLFNSFTRMDAIAIGILLAVVLRSQAPHIPRSIRFVSFILGIFCWWMSASVFQVLREVVSSFDGMMGYGCGTLGAVLVFISFLGAPDDGLRFLTWKPITYLGRISYGLYVVHQLVLEFTKLILFKTLGRDPLALRYVVALALTIPLAALSYRWLESPFLRLKRRFQHIVTSQVFSELNDRERVSKLRSADSSTRPDCATSER